MMLVFLVLGVMSCYVFFYLQLLVRVTLHVSVHTLCMYVMVCTRVCSSMHVHVLVCISSSMYLCTVSGSLCV